MFRIILLVLLILFQSCNNDKQKIFFVLQEGGGVVENIKIKYKGLVIGKITHLNIDSTGRIIAKGLIKKSFKFNNTARARIKAIFLDNSEIEIFYPPQQKENIKTYIVDTIFGIPPQNEDSLVEKKLIRSLIKAVDNIDSVLKDKKAKIDTTFHYP
jgi:hypothetical protein